MTDRTEVLVATAYELSLFADARGWLMVGPSDELYGPITYCYATTCYPGVVKAWHRHQDHTDRMWCVSGTARVVVAREQTALWDKAPNGLYDIHEFVIGPMAPRCVVIPPGWWHGFTPAGPELCVIINAPDMAYDPLDEERKPLDAIPFEWREVSG